MTYTYDDVRRRLDTMSDDLDEWQGFPIPVEGLPLRLHDQHPLRDVYAQSDEVEIRIVVGRPSDIDDDGERVVNGWYDAARNREVLIFQRSDGRAFAVTVPRSPDGSMARLGLWLMTLGASDAWDLDAEHRARVKLRGLLSERQWRHYDLTGTFLETSPRSRLTYMFRRLRPTIALTPRWKWYRPLREEMRCLAVLCLHPVGFYDKSWGGCMVPSDDVIAHLLHMRGDEAHFWRKANQHEPWRPEAGL